MLLLQRLLNKVIEDLSALKRRKQATEVRTVFAQQMETWVLFSPLFAGLHPKSCLALKPRQANDLAGLPPLKFFHVHIK